MAAKSGKKAGPGRSPKAKKATSKKPAKGKSRTSAAPPLADPAALDLSPVNLGGVGLVIPILQSEHPDLLEAIAREAGEEGLTREGMVLRALREVYGLPPRFQASFVVHVCPDCAARRGDHAGHAGKQ